MRPEESAHAQRFRALREVEWSGYVSATWQRHGWSQTPFQALRRRFLPYGGDGRGRVKAPGHPAGPAVAAEGVAGTAGDETLNRALRAALAASRPNPDVPRSSSRRGL